VRVPRAVDLLALLNWEKFGNPLRKSKAGSSRPSLSLTTSLSLISKW